MVSLSDFSKRVIERIPSDAELGAYIFQHWTVQGKPTAEGLGLLPVPGADPEAVLARVLNVDGYVGNVKHVVESRAIADASLPSGAVRFYQRIKVPLLGEVHNELVLERMGEHHGFQVAAWRMLGPETDALSGGKTIRSQYNDGVWLAASGVIGYAVSSAPRREDVGLFKWKALTAGADAVASTVIRETIEGMGRWAADQSR